MLCTATTLQGRDQLGQVMHELNCRHVQIIQLIICIFRTVEI